MLDSKPNGPGSIPGVCAIKRLNMDIIIIVNSILLAISFLFVSKKLQERKRLNKAITKLEKCEYNVRVHKGMDTWMSVYDPGIYAINVKNQKYSSHWSSGRMFTSLEAFETFADEKYGEYLQNKIEESMHDVQTGS